MKLQIPILLISLFVYIFITQSVQAENLVFNNEIFSLKKSNFSDINKGYENYYFPENETDKNFTKFIEIFHYPEIKNPIKFSENADKEIEIKSSVLLLKYLANKKANKAVLSFIDTGEIDEKPFIEHNIYKYEPAEQKGMMIIRYGKRYFATTKEEIEKIAKEIKNINDDLIEQIINSPTPQIISKEM